MSGDPSNPINVADRNEPDALRLRRGPGRSETHRASVTLPPVIGVSSMIGSHAERFTVLSLPSFRNGNDPDAYILAGQGH